MKAQLFKQQGFTLLELMVVIAIMGTLMTLAIPSYQRYSQRAKFTEVIQATLPYKTAITLCAYQQGDLDLCATPGQNGIPDNFEASHRDRGYVYTITVSDKGRITACSQQIKIASHDRFEYTLVPEIQENGSVFWSVNNDSPKSCKRYRLC